MIEKELMDNVDSKPNGYKVTINKLSDHNWIPSLQRPDVPFSRRSRREKYNHLYDVALSDYLVLRGNLTSSSHPSVLFTLSVVDFDPFL